MTTTAPGDATPPTPDPSKILETGLAFWASKTLLSAVEIGLFTELAKHPEPLDAVAARLGIHQRGARDFLDALVSLGFLERDDKTGIYSNTPDTETFLDRNKPSYVGGMLEMANHRLYPYWAHLTEALKTGLPQNEAKRNPDFFAELYADPARLREFLSAMTGVSAAANQAIAGLPLWRHARSYVDAGTAEGDLAVQIALANTGLTGIGFDLPQVGPVFEDYVADHGLTARVTFTGGDFFADPLPEADVVLMGHILHDWDLEQKNHLIKLAYDALPVGGHFVIYDTFIDDARRANTFGLLMSLNMLVETPGGFDYTTADAKTWLTAAGFREAIHHPLAGSASVLIATK